MSPADADITCPDIVVLERAAAGEETDAELTVHIATCPRCRTEMQRIREDNALVHEAIGASESFSTDVGPAIAGYELLGEIHRGGQGVVHRALHRPTNRTVALKTLLSGRFATSRQRQRFEREVELAARLRHPGIVSIYDSGVDEKGQCYVAMEFVEGQTLAERYPRGAPGRVDLREVLALFARLADAVAFAHAHGVIHRDLKPSNVIIDDEGQPRIVDFGIAKPAEVDEATRVDVTVTGEFVGTLRYAAPEQLTSDPDLADVRVDVYALGVMLYEAATGRSPHEPSASVAETLQRVVSQAPRAPSSLRDDIDRDAETILLTALALDPARRYQSAAALRDDLEAWLDRRAILARRDDAWYVARKWVQRHRRPVAAAGVFVLTLIGFGVTMTLLYGRATRAELQARESLQKTLDSVGSMTESLGAMDMEMSLDRVATSGEFLDTLSTSVRENLSAYPDVASRMHTSLGLAYLGQERLDEALTEMQAALAFERSRARGDTLALGEAQHNLGRALWKMGRFEEAETHYREALRIRRELLGEMDLDTARTMQHLSATIQNTGKLDEAEELISRAIEVRCEFLAPDHPDIANAQTAQGILLQDAGRYADSIEPLRGAYEIAVGAFGQSDWRAARVAHNLGISLRQMNDRDAAEALFTSALSAKRAWWGDESLDVSSTLIELGRLRLDGRGDVEGARAAAEEALTIHTALLSTAHPQQVGLLALLADLAIIDNQVDAGIGLLTESLEISRRVYGDGHWRTADALVRLGRVLLDADRVEAAAAALEEGVGAFRANSTVRTGDLARALLALSDCRVAQERHDDATRLRNEAERLTSAAD